MRRDVQHSYAQRYITIDIDCIFCFIEKNIITFREYRMSKIAAYTICGAAGIALLFNALTESGADIERKPDLVNQMVTISIQECDLQQNFNQTAAYKDRLEEVLMDTRSNALDFLLDNGITVCLDHRMSDVEEGFFDTDVHGLYFPDKKTISIYDNGDDSAHKGFFETAAISYSGKLLKEFVAEYDDGDLAEVSKPQFGYSYYQSTGKGGYQNYKWKNDAADYAVIKKNPKLLTPPLR